MMHNIQINLLLLVLLAEYSLALYNNTQVVNDLRALLSPDSKITLMSNAAASNDTAPRFNIWHSPNFAIAVKPSSSNDVSKIVGYAIQQKIPFLATGGRHGYSGSLDALHNAIEVDLGYLNTVKVDAKESSLTVGGSVRFSDLMDPVFQAKKAIPVGACPCVGMVGATLGGGIGFLSSSYGPISDSILSIEMVTADGSLITVSESSHNDLFWAMKGAGANYGIVTSLQYRVYDAPNGGQVMSADMLFPIATNGSMWQFAKSWIEKQPKELSLAFSLLFDPISKQLLILVNVIYTGPLASGQSILQPLLDLRPMSTNISYVPWSQVPFIANLGAPAKNCGKPTIMVPHAVNLYQIDVKALVDAVDYLNQTVPNDPALYGFVFAFTQYAQAGFQTVDSKTSSFPSRDVVMYAQMDGVATDPAQVPAIDQFGRRIRDLVQKSNSGRDFGVYTHFAHGDEGAASWYGKSNLIRLRELKKRYDPEGFFSYYNSVDRD